MPVKRHERDVLFFDLIVGARAQHASAPTLRSLVDVWQASLSKGLAPKTFEKGTVTATINDVAIDEENQTATILIEVADKNASNARYVDHTKRESRTFEKYAHEGNGYSAHVVVSLLEEKGQPHCYLALMEVAPTVGWARIQSVLNTALRLACAARKDLFTFPEPGGIKAAGGAPRVKPFVPHITLEGHPSTEFINDLEYGRILGLHLIERKVKQALAGSPHLQALELALKVSVDKNLAPGKKWDAILAGVKGQSKTYSAARISIQPVDGARSYSVEIDSEDGGLMTEGFIKRAKISKIDPMLADNSCDNIVVHFESMMKAILIKDRRP